MTGSFASRAFFTSAAIFGTDATHVGRGGQMTEVMSSTRRAAPLTGTSTATVSGILGIGDVGAAEAVGVGLGAAVVGAGVRGRAPAGARHAATDAGAAGGPTRGRMAGPPSGTGGGPPSPQTGPAKRAGLL